MTNKTVAIGCDHAGIALKEKVITELETSGFTVIDQGTDSEESVDYPDFAEKVSQTIINGDANWGILICGTGIGMSIAANRHKEIRAALCNNEETAALSRQHNNANILCMGARIINEATALACIKRFFTTDFEGGRHKNRVEKFS